MKFISDLAVLIVIALPVVVEWLHRRLEWHVE
jgi:hypothetical protein